jgi:hypothetical protein
MKWKPVYSEHKSRSQRGSVKTGFTIYYIHSKKNKFLRLSCPRSVHETEGMEETEVLGENHQPVTSDWQTLLHNYCTTNDTGHK